MFGGKGRAVTLSARGMHGLVLRQGVGRGSLTSVYKMARTTVDHCLTNAHRPGDRALTGVTATLSAASGSLLKLRTPAGTSSVIHLITQGTSNVPRRLQLGLVRVLSCSRSR